MFTVRLACGQLYGKQLFTWLSLVVSLMASFVLSFFPLDVLDEIWDLIESVSEGFLTYSCTTSMKTTLGLYCVGTTSMPLFPRVYWVLTASLFTHVLTTIFLNMFKIKTIKIASRPYRFLLRSFYVVQVQTASKRFYINVVGTWSSVTGVLGGRGSTSLRSTNHRP